MPKFVDHAARRQEVAQAAQRVIARVGIRETRLRDIAVEAGYSTGVLSHYFTDKDSLMLFALDAIGQRFFERMALQLAASGYEGGLRALRTALEQVLPLDDERMVQWDVWLAFFGAAVGNDELAALHLQHYREFRHLLEYTIRAGQEERLIAEALDPADEADRLLALVDGIALQAVFDRERWPAHRQLAFLDQHLVRLASCG